MINKFPWCSDYVLGVSLVDEQHKKLVEIIGKLFDALMGDKTDYLKNRVEILEELVKYTVYHFNCEEKLFDEVNYYAREPHALQHTMFVNQVEAQVKDLLESDIEKGEEFYNFLTLWLFSHISKSDKLFCQKYLSMKDL